MAVVPKATGIEASFDFHSRAAATTVEKQEPTKILTEEL